MTTAQPTDCMVDAPGVPILAANLRDLGELKRLEKRCFNEDDAWPLIELIGVLVNPGIVRLKMEVEGQMIAFFAGEARQKQGRGTVMTIGVDPTWQGRGLGARLLEAGEKALCTRKLSLSTRRNNLTAIRLYQKAGYKQTDIWKGYYFGEDALVFEKVCE